MAVFYFFEALLVWQGIASFVSGLRFLLYVRREMRRSPSSYTPCASVFVPCRGLDQGLRENLRAVLSQRYPSYEVIFVADNADDPALGLIAEECATLAGKTGAPQTRVVVAGPATESGQKVHNLIAGVRVADPASEVFIFVDTDARPHSDWLRALVAPLADEKIGAATGYRWFMPVTGGMASHLRSVWNASIASALGERVERNFCWGGSTAVRRETFARLDVAERWRGALSDDFTLTRVLREAKLPIHFVPQCLTATHEDCGFRELLEFTTRQIKITRVYAPPLWKLLLAGNFLFVTTFFGGIGLTLWRALRGAGFWPATLILGLIFILGLGKAAVRLRAVSLPLAADGVRLGSAAMLAHLCLWPLAAVVYLYNALAAAGSRRIRWRGITYDLKSPAETVIIASAPDSPAVVPEGKSARPYA
ncbi:MAG: glycosyltransferase [Pyrinomonadaceae bacterium]